MNVIEFDIRIDRNQIKETFIFLYVVSTFDKTERENKWKKIISSR